MSTNPNKPNRKRSYYYRSVRRGKKVRRIYIGPASDPVTDVIRRMDRSHKARRRLNRIAERSDVDRDFEKLLAAYDTRFHLICRLFKDRHMTTPRVVATAPSDPSHTSGVAKDDFLAIVERAEAGNAEAIIELEALLEQNPDLWRALGDIGHHVERHLINRASEASAVLRQSIPRHVEELRRTLTTDPGDPLEKLLIDRLITAQLEVAIRQIAVCEANSASASRQAQSALNLAQRRLFDCFTEMRRLRSCG